MSGPGMIIGPSRRRALLGASTGLARPLLPATAKRIEGMTCDHTGCKTPPRWGMRLIVPSQTQNAPGHTHIRLTLALHYCDEHKHDLLCETVLTDAVKAQGELLAKKTRPHDFKCDFGFAAHLVHVEIDSPEYQAFVAALERGMNAAQENWGGIIFA